MSEITIGGNPIQTNGTIPQKGDQLKDFVLSSKSFSDTSLKDFEGKKKVLNIFPSVDTAVCAQSIRVFNEKASSLDNTLVINISKDLPVAQNRFCAAEGLENVVNLSEFKDNNFSNDYGVQMLQGPLAGLMSRVVIIADENNNIIYSEQVAEVGQEPNYEAALSSLK